MQIPDIAPTCDRILTEVERAIIGKREVLEDVMIAILADGHILLEDFPGLAKTLLARSFAAALGIDFKRIQFTPDLRPLHITGEYIIRQDEIELIKGPVFTNLVLADEINRASPRTQSALLEAMQERQVSLENTTMALPAPFIVVATQNPVEYEGTFPLPEAQLDRFLLKLSMGYPEPEDEAEMLRRRRERRQDEVDIQQVTGGEELLAMRAAVEDVHVDADLESYIVALVGATRRDGRITVGASPRGSLALLKLARARAAFEGRDYVLPDDIKRFTASALSHRLILQPDLWMRRNAAEEIIAEITESTPVPLLKEQS